MNIHEFQKALVLFNSVSQLYATAHYTVHVLYLTDQGCSWMIGCLLLLCCPAPCSLKEDGIMHLVQHLNYASMTCGQHWNLVQDADEFHWQVMYDSLRECRKSYIHVHNKMITVEYTSKKLFYTDTCTCTQEYSEWTMLRALVSHLETRMSTVTFW